MFPRRTHFERGTRLVGCAAIAAAVGLVLCLAGCPGETSRRGLDTEDDTVIGPIGSKDFRSMCFKMAQSLVRIPQIQNASQPPTIAFLQVDNASTEIISGDDALYKTRTELIKNSGGRLVFLDRDAVEAILRERRAKERGEITSSSGAPLHGADFFMTGRIESIPQTAGRVKTTYVRFSFRLTDAATSAIVWEDDYEVKVFRRFGIIDR